MVLTMLAVAYAARPLSCSYVLGTFSVLDDVPYAGFDRHGISVSTGFLGALLCAYPLLWLAGRLLSDARTGDDDRMTGGSVARSLPIALAIGAPSFVQLEFMLALPFAVMWPVVLSAAAWAMIVASIWSGLIGSATGRRNMVAVRGGAVGVAVLVTLPKLMLFTIQV